MNMNKRAFTLIEIIITMAVLGVISSIVFLQFQGKEELINEVKIDAELRKIKTGVVSYARDNFNNFPSTEAEGCYLNGSDNVCDFLGEVIPYMGSLSPSIEYRYYNYDSVCEFDVAVESPDGTTKTRTLPCDADNIIATMTYPNSGSCGSANGDIFLEEPTDNLCEFGSLDPADGELNEADGAWSWNCKGSDGGSTASCVAFALGTLTCGISESPEDEDNDVHLFSMHNLDNSHAEMPGQNNYANKVFCSSSIQGILSNDCNGGTSILNLNGDTNAHVEKGDLSNYIKSACLLAQNRNISCDYVSSCSEDQACIASISSDTNAHVGNCDAYSIKVCCQINQ